MYDLCDGRARIEGASGRKMKVAWAGACTGMIEGDGEGIGGGIN